MGTKTIDQDEVLSFWYDSREQFTVQFDPKLVKIEVHEGSVDFLLKSGFPEKRGV